MFPLKTAIPYRYLPLATWTLIFLNSLVFLIEDDLQPDAFESLVENFALVPARYFTAGASPGLAGYLPFFTSMFLHAGWLHLIFNMWTLWLFGPAVEDRMGSRRYLGFYLACGVLASVTYALCNADSLSPMLGASGAIAGVLGCYVRLFPMARMIVLVPVIIFPLFFTVPAVVFIGLWFLLQLVQGVGAILAPTGGGGIAWLAHVGGFVAGLLLGPLLHRPPGPYRAYHADEGVLGFTPSGRR